MSLVGGRILQVLGGTILLGLLTYEIATWFGGEAQASGADRKFLADARTSALLTLWALFPAIYLWRAKRMPVLWVHAGAHYLVLGLGFLVLLAHDFHHRDATLFLNVPFVAALLFPVAVFVVSQRVASALRLAKTPLELYGHLLVVILLGFEIHGVVELWEGFDKNDRIATALISVAWAVYAFAVLWLGMKYEKSAWRWFALALLAVTLIKVLLFDMARVHKIWRVVSFAVLGALLMVCSYVYVRHERRKIPEPETDDSP